MWEENRSSILATGVPVERGKPQHIEHDDETARCDFNVKTGKILRIHTPQDSFRRVHELMHARHTDPKRANRQYKGIVQTVFDITEDCRIHTQFWPWQNGDTPEPIKTETLAFLDAEMKKVNEILEENPEYRGDYPDFSTRLRQVAIRSGMGSSLHCCLYDAGFVSDAQKNMAERIINLVRHNKEGKAARMLQSMFNFPVQDGERVNGNNGRKIPARNGRIKQPEMEIIELPHTVVIPEAKVGYRRATSGSRLHRPSLHKPVLPQKLFIRRSPHRPDGTILVDASSSMGDWSQVRKWCELAPCGTIAYYAGNCRSGKLYVYARGGRRAAEIVNPDMGGNTVDGPAMDWLMSQAKPRLMITDRGFCDAQDSLAQVARLEYLERIGEITVKDYANNSEDD